MLSHRTLESWKMNKFYYKVKARTEYSEAFNVNFHSNLLVFPDASNRKIHVYSLQDEREC